MSGARIPAGFEPLASGGEFIAANGPLYLYHQGDVVKLGFRVESRHTNPLGICHGGMMASFCDMLLPLSVHRKSREVGFVCHLTKPVNLQKLEETIQQVAN